MQRLEQPEHNTFQSLLKLDNSRICRIGLKEFQDGVASIQRKVETDCDVPHVIWTTCPVRFLEGEMQRFEPCSASQAGAQDLAWPEVYGSNIEENTDVFDSLKNDSSQAIGEFGSPKRELELVSVAERVVHRFIEIKSKVEACLVVEN